MVTCSKDRSIAVWDMASATDITLRRVLVGHRAAVNVVDFDDKYIVSASGDRTIKVSVSAVITLLVAIPFRTQRKQRWLIPTSHLARSLFSSTCAYETSRHAHSLCFSSRRQGHRKASWGPDREQSSISWKDIVDNLFKGKRTNLWDMYHVPEASHYCLIPPSQHSAEPHFTDVAQRTVLEATLAS